LAVTDVHMHLVPSGLVDRVRGGLSGVALSRDGHVVLDGQEIGVAALYEPRRLEDALDERGVDVGCVSAPPPLYRQTLPLDEGQLWTQAVNDSLEELARSSNGRVRCLAHLPVEHPAVALSEASARRGPDWAGFAIASHAPDVTLADAGLRPLWELLDERGAFVFVHPGEPEDARLANWYLTNLLGNPYETGLAAAQLVFGGVVASFERIRFCLAHAGGVTAALAGRWQQGFDTERPGVPREHAPRTLLRRLYVDCVAFSDLYLELAAAVFGADHVLLGSDWPFPMGAAAGDVAGFGANATRALELDPLI
jgi:aminocarboxymuconate-semialdehyde decarboxylase